MIKRENHFELDLLTIFIIQWIFWSISPISIKDWLHIEHIVAQGDVCGAQKDMLLVAIGDLAALLILYIWKKNE